MFIVPLISGFAETYLAIGFTQLQNKSLVIDTFCIGTS